jgi:hypothetical protein
MQGGGWKKEEVTVEVKKEEPQAESSEDEILVVKEAE